VILVVQSVFEVKAPLVVERVSAHPCDKGRVMRRDNIDRVSVVEEIFVEAIIEVIEIE